MIEIIIGIKYYRLSGSFLFNSLSRTCLLFLILATDNTDRFFWKNEFIDIVALLMKYESKAIFEML